MCGVIVHDQVNVQILGDIGVEIPQEAQELLVAVPHLALREHLPRGYVQRGEEGGRAVATVVMCDALDVSQTTGQTPRPQRFSSRSAGEQ